MDGRITLLRPHIPGAIAPVVFASRRAVALSVPVIVPALWLMTESSFGLLVTLGIVCAA